MVRWTLLMVLFLSLTSCGRDEDVKEPGEKVVAGRPGGGAPARTAPEARPKPLPRKDEAAPAKVESSTHKANGEPITDPDDLPGKDPALQMAVEVGLHDTGAPAPELVKPVIELNEAGQIAGPIPDMAPELGYLFETDNFVCPGNSVIQGARPPKGRELGCRISGMLVGPFIEWYENGQRQVEKQYVDGVKQGPSRQWYRDGSLQAVRFFEKSAPHGRYARWHVNGRIAETGEYEFGKEVGPWTGWFPNGQKESEGMYVVGRQEGPWIYWFPNGQKKREGKFDEGQKTGIWTFWHQNGQLQKEGEYRNDVPAQRLRMYAEDGTILQ
ncbi:MAG: toxin-antitoxin system YwqK family antitoxin [Pseudomonadota bacterium]